MKAKVLLAVLTLFVLAGDSPAHADDWQRLREAADKMFAGWDVTVSLTTGVSTKTYLEGTNQTQSGPYGKLEMKVPLYSKQERIAQQSAKQAFLQKGAEFIKTMEEGKRKIRVLEKKSEALKAYAQTNGIEAINKYYDIQVEIVKEQEGVSEAKKKFDAMLIGP
jgi:hypothetical protein